MQNYDVIVVGGGHAGVEAAHASAKMGLSTLLITLNAKMISNMPCNPSIGGSAKGVVVREVDALGGIMGKAADKDYLQMKMLNTGKGPGVQCLRAQEDKHNYPGIIQEILKNTTNLTINESEVIDLIHDDKSVTGVILKDGREIKSKAVILATGTYMESMILRGKKSFSGGPDGENPSIGLSKSLQKMGIEIIRFKTGTPPRIKKSSIDFSKASIQPGMDGKLAFSYETTDFIPLDKQLPCYLIYSNEKTHEIIRNNLDKTATYNGLQTGVGPRYCPSIESKVMTFIDKKRHQLFLEPEFKDGESIYLQGFSTAMEEDIQEQMVHSLEGLEKAVFLKYAYAIEYDALIPTQFDASLKVKKYNGLYVAGQICGTSGYEEAAGLGLLAGINASLFVLNKEPFILKRNESYIGVMIDDIVTKGTNEPYRLLSSRAEYRLLLRHDNADIRLTPYGYKYGLISEERYHKFIEKNQNIEKAISYLKNHYLGSSERVNSYLQDNNIEVLKAGVSGYEFLKRPNVNYQNLLDLFPELNEIKLDYIGISQLEIFVKYEGYIKREKEEATSFTKFEEYKLPSDVNYLSMNGLALEARQKLDKIRPLTIGQASRISGVNPSDISILILELKEEMNELDFRNYLIEELHVNNIEDVLNKFNKFEALLIEWNNKFNLTRITKHEDILIKHFIDSIYSVKFVDFNSKCIVDLGSGAGFPGIPLAILFPSSSFTLIEANGKKCSFLNETIKELNLSNVTVLNSRIEEVDKKEHFDYALSRAVSELNILLELAIPLLKVEGKLIAYKVFDNEFEIEKSENALKKLNSKIEANFKYLLPFNDDPRSIIIIKKIDSTSSKYPRNYSFILKKPL